MVGSVLLNLSGLTRKRDREGEEAAVLAVFFNGRINHTVSATPDCPDVER